MEGLTSNEQKNNIINKVTIFTVPFDSEQIIEGSSFFTNAFKKNSKEHIVQQAFKFHKEGNIYEAAKYYQVFIDQGYKDYRVFSNYGVVLKDLGNVQEAELLFRKAIEIKPDFADAYFNLGNILRDLGNVQEAELLFRKAIEIKPDFTRAHSNLALLLKYLGKLKDAEASQLNAIKINPELGENYSNLGKIYKDLGKYEEAELSLIKAIELNPALEEAYLNLGNVLMISGKYMDAEKFLNKAIKIKSDYAIAYRNLSICFYIKGERILALEYICIAENIEPDEELNKVLKSFFEKNKIIEYNNFQIKNNTTKFENEILKENPLIINRFVEQELIDSLYEIRSIDQSFYIEPTYGNARGSDYSLFKRNDPIINMIKNDLISIASESVHSEIIVLDSFFTISKSGAGLVSHNHLSDVDNLKGLNLSENKFSLVYYLSIGDQDCEEPGILKLEDPKQEILPNNGLIIIFPAWRNHSVFYKGKKDRIIIGMNFYRV